MSAAFKAEGGELNAPYENMQIKHFRCNRPHGYNNTPQGKQLTVFLQNTATHVYSSGVKTQTELFLLN